MEKELRKFLLVSIIFLAFFLAFSENVISASWDSDTRVEQIIYVDYAWTGCMWTQHPSASDCYSRIPGSGYITQYSDICDGVSFWKAAIDGCGLWYERRACWRVYAKEDKNLANSYFTVLNSGTDLNCEEKCNSEFGFLNSICVGIGRDTENRDMKYLTGGVYPYVESGNCNTVMIDRSPANSYSTNCFCLKCKTGYRDCNNQSYDGCEKTCCDLGQYCSVNSDCCSGAVCSNGKCIPSGTGNQCNSSYSNWYNATLSYNQTSGSWYHKECTGEWQNYIGCVVDTDGNGFFDKKCCPLWNHYFNMVVWVEPSSLNAPCREGM